MSYRPTSEGDGRRTWQRPRIETVGMAGTAVKGSDPNENQQNGMFMRPTGNRS